LSDDADYDRYKDAQGKYSHERDRYGRSKSRGNDSVDKENSIGSDFDKKSEKSEEPVPEQIDFFGMGPVEKQKKKPEAGAFDFDFGVAPA